MHWPADGRLHQPGSHRRAGKNTRYSLGNTLSQNFPRLETGTLNAATLHRVGRRYEWMPIIDDSSNRRLSVLNAPVLLWQSSRRLDVHSLVQSNWKTAAQQASFLSKHYLEVDIDQSLVQDQIMSEFAEAKELARYDPYVGNLVRPIYFPGLRRPVSGVAYATGETRNTLNICTLTESASIEDLSVSRTFKTPIKQIEVSPFNHLEDSSYLSVRTMGGLSFFRVTFVQGTPELEHILELSRDQIGDRPAIDVKLQSPFVALVSNDRGGLFTAKVEEPDISITTIRESSNEDVESGLKPFFKMATTNNRYTCLLASNKALELVDLRDDTSALELYMTSPSELMASIDYHHNDELIRFMTTTDIVWLDMRSPRKALFTYKHQLSSTHSLDIHTEAIDNTFATFASSTSNGLISVYDVSRSGPIQPCRFNSRPYALSAPLGAHQDHEGYAFFKHPNDDRAQIIVVQLSKHGSLCFEQLGFQSINDLPSFHRPVIDDVQQEGSDDEWIVPLKKKNYATVDMSPIYGYLANKFELGSDEPLHEVEDTLERMVHVLQEEDGPIDNVMTTLEIAARTTEERDAASRADFLSSIHINSRASIEAFQAELYPFENLRRAAAWEHNLKSTLDALKGEISDPPSIGPLSRAAGMMKELEFDLAMGSHIYSSRKISSASTDVEMQHILSATETLSIAGDGEPPAIAFGFLRPTERPCNDEMDHDAGRNGDGGVVPLGARVLLKDWEVGQHPDSYNFVSPMAEPIVSYGGLASPVNNRTTQLTRIPPTIAATSQPAAAEQNLPQSRDLFVASQDSRPRAATVQSQEYNLASTQPLPGPFGSRPGIKKKPKRVGGF